MSSYEMFCTEVCDHLLSLGYKNPRCEIRIARGRYGSAVEASVEVSYYDSLDEFCSHFFRRMEGEESFDTTLSRAREHFYALKPAVENMKVSAVAAANRLKQRLIDAGFEKEVWMAELEAFIEHLSSNALTRV